MTDAQIREILIERKKQEKHEAEEAKWNEITDWCKAFMFVGFAFYPVICILFGNFV